MADQPAARERARLVVSPMAAPEVAKRSKRAVTTDDDVGEVNRLVLAARIVQDRGRQRPKHAWPRPDEPDVGETAEECHVDGAIPKLLPATSLDQLRRYLERPADARRHVGVDGGHVRC